MSINVSPKVSALLHGTAVATAEGFWKILSHHSGPLPSPPAGWGASPLGPRFRRPHRTGVGNTSCAVACGAHWDRWANGRTQLGPPHFLPWGGGALLTFLRPPTPQNNTSPAGIKATAPAAASSSGDIGQAGPSICHQGTRPRWECPPPCCCHLRHSNPEGVTAPPQGPGHLSSEQPGQLGGGRSFAPLGTGDTLQGQTPDPGCLQSSPQGIV